MTIVTKNSLTLSNVNDGTITHIAYAYSADGTDRFTTVYPNLNLLKGTKTSKSITGNNAINQGGLLYSFDNNSTLNNQGFSINDTITLEFDWSATNPASGHFLLQWQGTPWGFNAPTINLSSTNGSGHVIYTYNIRAADVASTAVATGIGYRLDNIPTNTIITFSNVIIRKAKGSQPWMQSASEVTTADWPSYIGQYTDFAQADSTNPSDYTWSLMRGNDGKDGAAGKDGANGKDGTNGTNGKDGTSVTITSKQILYQNSTSGTTAPTGTWSTTIPSTPQGQFRWARTIVNYSDGTSTQTDLVGYVGVDGQVGPQGAPTGITQQATEPSNKYAGMMWQYTGTSSITIGSTTIAPQVQYIYDGEQWRMYILNVANMNAQTLAAITANLGTVTAGMIKSYIDYTYYNNSATGVPAKAYLRIDANNVNQKIALQSPSGVDWGYIRQDVNGITIFADTENAGTIGNASGRYVSTNYGGAGISFINSNNASINANGDLDVAMPYTGTGSLYFDGKNLVSSAPIKTLADIGWTNTGVGSCRFKKNGNNVILDVNITPNAKPLVIGTLPIGCRPSHALMQMGTSWSANPNDGMHVQIDTDGKMTLYGTVGLGISTQVLFGID